MSVTDDPLSTIDSKDLEADIDKAIDELFVQKSPKQPSPAAEGTPAAEKTLEAEPAAEADLEKAEPAGPFSEELQALRESLLSLDWEITTGNIQTFERQIQALSEKLSYDRYSSAALKMALGVSKYLRLTKTSASAESMQLLHAAIQTLEQFISGPAIVDAERKRGMDKLLTKFQRLKAEAQRLKAAASSDPQPESEPVAEYLVAEEGPEPSAPAQEDLTPAAAEIEETAPEPDEEGLELPSEDQELELALEEEEPESFPEETPSPKPPPPSGREASTRWQELVQQAKDQSVQLSTKLAALGNDTNDFFDRLLQSISGKSAFERVSSYFVGVRKSLEDQLATVSHLASSLGQTTENLQQGSPPEGPRVGAEEQLQQLQQLVQSVNERLARLESRLGAGDPEQMDVGKPEPAAVEADDAEEAELLFPSEELDLSEELLELDEEIAPEPLSHVPPSLASIYLVNVAGNTLGIPTEAMAGAYKISKRKAKSLRKRGHATLADFKGLFRSIKRGLTGPLAEQSVKELKKIQFPIVSLSPEVLGDPEAKAQPHIKGVVLLSTGEHHATLLTDDVLEKRPYEVLGHRQAGVPGEVSGTVIIEGDFEINVLDPERLLS